MPIQHDVPALEDRRGRLYSDLAEVGDFRPGSLTAVPRRCGKANCACAADDHPGHLQHRLTKKVEGKTTTVSLRPGRELEKVAGEVANYQRFKGMVAELVEVNEQICESRPAGVAATGSGPEDQKRGPRRRSGQRSRAR